MQRAFTGKLLLLSLVALHLYAAPQKSGGLVDEAWKFWLDHDQSLVEKTFKAALEEDKHNTRAYLGLAYLYTLQQKEKAAWEAYRKVIETEPDYYPYLYAAWSTAKMLNNLDDSRSGIVDLYRQLTGTADRHGLLKALAHQALGQYYRQHGQLSESRQHFEALEAVTEWAVIGPFDNISASGFHKTFPPETAFAFDKVYPGTNGTPAEWFNIAEVRPDGWIDFRRYFAKPQSVFYANTFVYSPRQQTVQVRVGTSGSFKAFLNDELIIEYPEENNNDLDTYIAETELPEGWNRLLIKVGYSEIEQCNFMVRLTDSTGEPLKDLKFSPGARVYPVKPGAPVKVIPNFAETFFRQKIETYPDHLENYLLLADCYLRNDKAVEAELLLKAALRLAPDCPVFYLWLIEAYTRGEKYDEIATTMERMADLDADIPQVLEYKTTVYLENNQLDRAEESLRHLESLTGRTAKTCELYIALYTRKNQVEKIIETSYQGYKQFSDSWTLAVTEATINTQVSRAYERAIEIYRDFLKRRYDIVVLENLADAYLNASLIDKWEETYQKIFQIDPAATGYYYQMGNTYFSLQRYREAQRILQRAIDICPNSSGYWALLAEIYRTVGATDEAQDAYRKALTYNPANYEAREKLRELQGRPTIFSHFETIDIEKLINESPPAENYPNEGAVILLENMQRVVYEQGASEMARELLVKVFNNRGIDQFKEYRINYNAYHEDLIIEKAVVVKRDRSEIQADINKGHIVFKSLESGDFLHLKWKIKNYYSGKLCNHFWDRVLFNGFYPKKNICYSLLVADGLEFNYRAQNMSAEPTIRETKDGRIYRWMLTDEPALKYEYGMPILEDVGKVLYISSIGDWDYMVEWYRDLARSRTRSSYEIREQLEKLLADTPEASEEEIIKHIYRFITENIRYSSVPFRQSDLIPRQARDVLVTRIGDCKDMTTLCIAMLREVNIEAFYVLLNTRNEGRNLCALPSAAAFNHCIAGVKTPRGMRYLDLTAHNYPYGSLPEVDIGSFSLVIKPGVKAPTYLSSTTPVGSNLFRSMKVKIHPDNHIEVQRSGICSGALGASMRQSYRHQAPVEQKKLLLESLANQFTNLKLSDFQLNHLEEIDSPLQIAYRFTVPGYVQETGGFKFFKIPWSDPLPADKALSYEERNFPYEYWPGADTLREETIVSLPPGFQPLELGQNVQLSCPIADYTLTLSFEDGLIKARREMVYKKSTVLPAEYPDFRKFYNMVVKEDARQILLRATDTDKLLD